MCERTGEVASYVVARYYEVEKGENHEMVEGTSWMVRWKAVGKAVLAGPQSRRGSKSSSSERASGKSHPCHHHDQTPYKSSISQDRKTMFGDEMYEVC